MSMRYPGGLIASTPVNAAYPSGVWTQAQTQPYAAQNVWMRDQYWPYTTLLLQGNGTNGAQNNTFLDSSTNNFTITRNGNTTQGSFTPYEANGYWSNYFDGSSILTFASSANYVPGAGQFCLECWFFPTSTSGDRWLIGNRNGNYVPFAINYASTSYPGSLLFYVSSNGSSWDVVNGTTVSGVSANQWNHFALVRNSSNQFIVYINGVGTTIATNAANFSSAQPFYVGGSPSAGDADFIGYISNTRFVKGDSVYSGNFTPSITPLTAITNTQLLTSQSNRFLDNSSNAVTPSITGSPSVQAFQPFPGATTYSTTVLGGSGYFDGSGDYLTTPTSGQFAPSGDFTIGCWIYPVAAASGNFIGNYTANVSTDWQLNRDASGTLNVYTNGSTVRIASASNALPLGAWSYVAVCRSGSTITAYINGTSVGTYSQSGTFGSATKTIGIGANGAAVNPFTGYISNVLLVDGSATTTVPTSPSTAVTGTSLLLNFTNAGIFDTATMNDLETVGNAQVSTSVVKYGTGSMAFDGTGDYLDAKRAALIPSTGNFTVEAWIYPTSFSNYPCILSQGTTATTGRFLFSLNATTGALFMQISGTSGTFGSGSTITLNTWQHVAVVRNGSTFTGYVNGVPCGTTYTSTDAIQNTSTWVGNSWGNEYFFGNIDDLRVTQAARYSGNFTPPPARFPGQ